MNYKNGKLYFNLAIVIIPLLIILIPPEYLLRTNTLNTVNSILVIILFIILIILTFIKKRFNIFIILSVLLFFWQSFSSYYFSNGPLDISNNLRIISSMLLVNLTIRKYPKSTFNALSYLFAAYIVFNFLTFIFFKNGLYIDHPRPGQYRSAWLLGIDNLFAFYLIPGIIFVVINSLYLKDKISKYAWFIIFIAGLTLFIAWSATAILSFIFVVLLLVLISNKRFSLILNFKFMLTSYIIIWFTIVYLHSFAFLQGLIVDFLKKDMTFSGRTHIWEKVLETIPESLWYGFGNNTYVVPNKVTEFRSHNMILQLILDNGIIGLLIFLICLITIGFQFAGYKNDMITLVLLTGIFGILFGGLAEAYKMNYLFLLMMVSYNYVDLYIKGKYQKVIKGEITFEKEREDTH